MKGPSAVAAQAYGAGNFKTVGVVLQRALLICLFALVALVPLWACMEPVLLAMGASLPSSLRHFPIPPRLSSSG